VEAPIGIPPAELRARRERLQEHVERSGLSGYVLFDEHYIQYFTSFGFLATERPVAVISTASAEPAAFVPEFEVERVRAEAEFDRIESYPEYPGREHPMVLLARVLAEMGMRGPIGADQDGYPGILGYAGPPLSQVTESAVTPLSAFIEGMMVRKSDAEVTLIRESARWCAEAHRLLQKYTRPGRTETEASLRASQEATLAMFETLGPATGGRSAVGAPGRMPSPTTSSSGAATCS
jgi:Xaa-Pro aminopeptidase